MKSFLKIAAVTVAVLVVVNHLPEGQIKSFIRGN
jgi:hypothetical protein